MPKKFIYEFGDRSDPYDMPVVEIEADNLKQAWKEVTSKVAGSEAFPEKPTVKAAKKELFFMGRTSASQRGRLRA